MQNGANIMGQNQQWGYRLGVKHGWEIPELKGYFNEKIIELNGKICHRHV
jgi:hypothetical protein